MTQRYARFCDNNYLESSTVIAPESSPYVFANSYDLANRNKLYKPGTKQFTIEIDTQSNTSNISFFSILGASDSQFKLSDSAVVTLKGNSLNLFTGSEPYSETVSVGEIGAYLNVATDDYPNGLNYRYWQVEIDDQYNPDDIEIAYIYLGDHTIIHRNINNGFNYTIIDRTLRGVSDSGKVFALRKPEQTVISAQSRQFMTETDKKNIIAMGRKNGLHTPFLYVLDPEQCNTDHDFSVRAVYFDRQVPVLRHIVKAYYSASYSLREVI